MSKKKRKKRPAEPRLPAESRPAEAATVAWTVSLTALLFCELAAVAVHLYTRGDPAAEKMLLLRGMLLFGACVVGALVLGLLPVMYRLRRVAPPPGLAVFGALAAAAPILAVLMRWVR